MVTTRGSERVDDYIAGQPWRARPLLRTVRRLIRRLLPDAEETMSYQIPTYKQHGRAVIYFAGWRQHWSLYPVTLSVRKALGPALDSYQMSKGTIRFPLTDPVPARLVERIVKELARTTEARAGAMGRTSKRADGARRRRRTTS